MHTGMHGYTGIRRKCRRLRTETTMSTATIRRFRDLGAVIKAVRESRGIRQEDLAGDLAISRNYLQELENGKPTLYITRLFRALNKLGITLSVTYTLGKHDNV
ncbi:helix-turn-helix domain-containing protein [Cryobacterium sp. MDB2-A-1]|nr:helix-turn-helix domain-containing protein [Cryobacterium sp. MDB2-A-1]